MAELFHIELIWAVQDTTIIESGHCQALTIEVSLDKAIGATQKSSVAGLAAHLISVIRFDQLSYAFSFS